jgi:hypothetical protein
VANIASSIDRAAARARGVGAVEIERRGQGRDVPRGGGERARDLRERGPRSKARRAREYRAREVRVHVHAERVVGGGGGVDDPTRAGGARSHARRGGGSRWRAREASE